MKRVLTAAVVVLLGSTLAMAAPINIDLGTSSSPIQTGWVQYGNNGDSVGVGWDHNNCPDVGGGVLAGYVSSYNSGSRNRILGSSWTGFGLNDLLSDFDFPNTSGSGNPFRIKGLDDGTYDVTVYSLDGEYGSAGATWQFQLNSVALTIGPRVDGTLDSIRATGTVTLSSGAANNILDIYNTDASAAPLNAVIIQQQTPVPEPATILLFASGALGLLRYIRRQRMR